MTAALRTTTTCALALVLGNVHAAAAQRQPLPPPGQAAPPAAVAEPASEAALRNLLELPGSRVDMRYAADTLDRASRVQRRLETLHELWQPLAPAPLGWRAAAVTEETWNALGAGRPWGLPVRLGESLFVVPAHGDAGTVAAVERLLGGKVPVAEGLPVTGTPEEVGSLAVSDVLLQVEAARAFVATAGLAGDEPWIDGVLVQLAARLAWEAAEPGRTLEIVALFDRIAVVRGGPRAHRLADYQRTGDAERELWFQAQFVRGADAIWVEEGRFGTQRRLTRWISRRKPVTRAELEKRYPALGEWQRAAFAP